MFSHLQPGTPSTRDRCSSNSSDWLEGASAATSPREELPVQRCSEAAAIVLLTPTTLVSSRRAACTLGVTDHRNKIQLAAAAAPLQGVIGRLGAAGAVAASSQRDRIGDEAVYGCRTAAPHKAAALLEFARLLKAARAPSDGGAALPGDDAPSGAPGWTGDGLPQPVGRAAVPPEKCWLGELSIQEDAETIQPALAAVQLLASERWLTGCSARNKMLVSPPAEALPQLVAHCSSGSAAGEPEAEPSVGLDDELPEGEPFVYCEEDPWELQAAAICAAAAALSAAAAAASPVHKAAVPAAACALPRSPRGAGLVVPLLDLAGCDRGRFIEAMFHCGAIFVKTSLSEEGRGDQRMNIPDPAYDKWRKALAEAQQDPKSFYWRRCVQERHLRLSWREDLKRTMDGSAKDFAPDSRVMFGMSDSAVHEQHLQWDDLRWILDEYSIPKDALAQLIREELEVYCVTEKEAGTMGVKLREGKEKWGQSALRQCFYWENGSCTQHTDYGVATMQHCTDVGFEGFVRGEWHTIETPPGCRVVIAGDMLERLTNGRVKALLHRVVIPPEHTASAKKGRRKGPRILGGSEAASCRRQSHVLFLQPDRDTVVAPLARFLQKDPKMNLPPVRYRDWHSEKVNLAFGHI